MLVSDIPDARRPRFSDCSANKMDFPFKDHTKHHYTKPDLVVSMPGVKLKRKQTGENPRWQSFSMVMEAKATAEQDPFEKTGDNHANTRIQISTSARNLLFAHGFLAAFVIGIYGDRARIIRYDRSCATVSQPFDYRTQPEILRRFFWKLVHPVEGKTVVGCDPSVSRLTQADVDWVKEQLKLTRGLRSTPSDEEMLKGRKIDVPEDMTVDSPTTTYILFDLIDVNARLFSRSTIVWRGMKDTRGLVNTSRDSDALKPVCIVMKEAWHQIVRRPETDFYERLQLVPEGERIGLPRMLNGCDYGKRQVGHWRASGGRLPRYGPEGEDPGPVESKTTTAVSGAGGQPKGKTRSSAKNKNTFPLPYPQYQTHSYRLLRGSLRKDFERSLVRMIVDVVGRPINRFASTRELTEGFRDSIKGPYFFSTLA